MSLCTVDLQGVEFGPVPTAEAAETLSLNPWSLKAQIVQASTPVPESLITECSQGNENSKP